MRQFNEEVQKFYGQDDERFFDKLYQTINRQALAPFFRPHLRRPGRILDAGAGSGYLARELGLRDACFVDLTWEQLKQCRISTSGIFLQGDLAHLPFADGAFDTVLSANVLHYTGRPGLDELIRVTKSSGRLLLAFLEGSFVTRQGVNLAVFWGLFPPFMKRARFLNLSDLWHVNLMLLDSATITFSPPMFQAWRQLPRLGLVALVLEKCRAAEQPRGNRPRFH